MPYIPQIVDPNTRRPKTYSPQGGTPLYPFGSMLPPQPVPFGPFGGQSGGMGSPLGAAPWDQRQSLPLVPSIPPLPAGSYLPSRPSMPPARLMPMGQTQPATFPQRTSYDSAPAGNGFAEDRLAAQLREINSQPIETTDRRALTPENSQWANGALRDIAFEQGRTPANVQGMMAAQANAYQMGDHPSQRGLMPQRSMEETMYNAAQRQALGRSTAAFEMGSNSMSRLPQLLQQQGYPALGQPGTQQPQPLGPPVRVWLDSRSGMEGVSGVQDVPGDVNQSGYLQPEDVMQGGNRYQVRTRGPVENPLYVETLGDGRVQLAPREGWSRPEDQDERMAASRDRRQDRRNRLKEARAGYYAAKNSGGVRSTGQPGRQAAAADDLEGRKVPSLADFAPPPRADANGNPVPPTPEEQTSAAFRWIDTIVDANLSDAELAQSFQDSGVTMADVRTLLQESRSRKSFWGESRLEQESRRAREQILERLYKMVEAGDSSRKEYPPLPSSPVGGYLNPTIVPSTGVM